ncbi:MULTISPECIES: hypothetical protein [Pantoea]|uniref:hypothetical protein n=1 Tax=Pantoea TaxID=53335 RepID=UPI001681A93A|nr:MULTISPECIES: hypothetical protein [Pantoea]
MRRFSTGGYTFYILQRGERAPDPLADTGFCGAYLIWPRKNGYWDVREFISGQWQEITDVQFDTESAAFSFVYEQYRIRVKAYIRKVDARHEGLKDLALPEIKS